MTDEDHKQLGAEMMPDEDHKQLGAEMMPDEELSGLFSLSLSRSDTYIWITSI